MDVLRKLKDAILSMESEEETELDDWQFICLKMWKDARFREFMTAAAYFYVENQDDVNKVYEAFERRVR